MSDTTPFISVLMPVGDDGAWIVRALGSALDQQYPRERMEVIVVDRGSRDGSRDVAMRATYDRRARLIDLPSATHAAALAHARESARGEIIVLLDGRTSIPPGFLAACAAALGGANSVAFGTVVLKGSPPWVSAWAAASGYTVGKQPLAFRRVALAGGDSLVVRLPSVSLPPDCVATRPGPASFSALWAWHMERGRVTGALLRRGGQIGPQQFPGLVAVALAGSTLLAPLLPALRPLLRRAWGWSLLGLALTSLGAANSQPAAQMPSGSTAALSPSDLLPYLPLAFASIYLAYGCGLLVGLIDSSSNQQRT